MAKKQKVNSSQYSSYWFDDEDYDIRNYYRSSSSTAVTKTKSTDDEDYSNDGSDIDADDADREAKTERLVELIKLGAFMRSCGNFVRILTSRDDIRVRYEDGDNSYTDGKTVTLSSKVENNFDSTVGLALHEASHIVLTNFELLSKLFEDYKFRRQYITTEMIEKVIKLNPKIEKWNWASLFSGSKIYPQFSPNASPSHRCADIFLVMQFKDVLNWIEDRRIDNWVYSTASGYRGYYEALYNRYFYSDEVTKSLKGSKTHNTETLDSYMYRLINLLNSENDISVLKGMKKIKSDIDVPHISRLTSTEQVADISSKVLNTIMENITELDYMSQQMNKFKIGNGVGEDGMEINIDALTEQECKDMFGMGKSALKKLLKKMAEQRQFVRGQLDKKKLSKNDARQMNGLQSSGVTLELAGGEEFNGQTVKVLVLEKVNDAIISNSQFGDVFLGLEYNDSALEKTISEGFSFGKQLGRRLQIRNEERSLKFTRQNNGKIDRRLVSSLGYDVVNIFSKIEVNKFNKAHIHVSVDASGSMGGTRFMKAVKTCVAIAVACKMTSNLECVITFRTTNNNLPLVYVGYDSRKNQLSHIRKYFPSFVARGTTPESLCFEAIMNKVFPTMTRDEQFFFVNLSDGEPAYSAGRYGNSEGFYYGGDNAYRHCRRMVDKMIKEKGATVISYLITDYDKDIAVLKQMYGNSNAFSIDTDNLEQIARTMNKKFLEKSHQKTTENVI